MTTITTLSPYQHILASKIIEIAASKGLIIDKFLESEDLSNLWTELGKLYLVNALGQFNDYPEVSIAWAAYLGLGAAHVWDKNWSPEISAKEFYCSMIEKRGFDAMDDFITEGLYNFKVDSKKYREIKDLFLSTAHSSLKIMKNQNVEPMTKDSLNLFYETISVFYILGVSLGLSLLGYKYTKI